MNFFIYFYEDFHLYFDKFFHLYFDEFFFHLYFNQPYINMISFGGEIISEFILFFR